MIDEDDDFMFNDEEEDEMQARAQAESMFGSWDYTKNTTDIQGAIKTKVAALREKIGERERRVKMIRDEYKITDAMLIDLLRQAREAQRSSLSNMSYQTSAVGSSRGGMHEEVVTIGAGTINNLLTEGDFIEAEKKDIARLELIGRNIKPRTKDDGSVVDSHRLNIEELRYLGF